MDESNEEIKVRFTKVSGNPQVRIKSVHVELIPTMPTQRSRTEYQCELNELERDGYTWEQVVEMGYGTFKDWCTVLDKVDRMRKDAGTE